MSSSSRFGNSRTTPANKPVLVLIHGSSLCALPSYDLRVPGRGSEYSMMDICAERGYDVWTLDHEGYGKSSRTGSNSNIAMAVDDIGALLPILKKETGQTKFHFYGQSSGALRAAKFAQAYPDNIGRLVLDAFVWTGEGSPTLAKRREGLAEYRASNTRKLERKNLIADLQSRLARRHPRNRWLKPSPTRNSRTEIPSLPARLLTCVRRCPWSIR